MRNVLIIIFLSLFCANCNPFENKNLYEIKTGDTFELYINENSCCQNCFVNKMDLKHTLLVSVDVVIPEPKGCAGCTSIYAWKFKSLSAGTDTIKIVNISGGESCDSIHLQTFDAKEYIVHIK